MALPGAGAFTKDDLLIFIADGVILLSRLKAPADAAPGVV